MHDYIRWIKYNNLGAWVFLCVGKFSSSVFSVSPLSCIELLSFVFAKEMPSFVPQSIDVSDLAGFSRRFALGTRIQLAPGVVYQQLDKWTAVCNGKGDCCSFYDT